MTEQTIEPDDYELSLGGTEYGTATHVGLHMTHGTTRTTVAFSVPDAERIGKLLVAHADYVNGRPPRDWGD
ncbi:Uncharacterised protein [Mycobacteroides abscessus subsp. massiliense]|uniref:hypothetical protein n=1 Tax=Mycobacteroides abscessus TaxID=36809 RepID=UPI0009A5B182|nr:hypothetical protein [Mycobacteroides abscessus]SKK75340.1 Uncharacterised protein [Mycobacteroides abscessus subsp. massiliense]SKL00749.1 Uncharacterised protein [Mycobacteroides abscessus subsp. massiliense]SKM11228.1 Uncharacterised protein [Mycobacteroides abscessus subsp. massiliense]